jgi:hypothetical protein
LNLRKRADALTWTKNCELKLGPLGTNETTFTFTRAGGDKAKDMIDIKVALTYTQPREYAMAGLPFTVKSAKLTCHQHLR